MYLVDTNVLLDLVTDDSNWSEWSLARLEEAALGGPVLINDVVYAETSIRYERIEDLDALLADAMIEIAPTPRPAAWQPSSCSASIRKSRLVPNQRKSFCWYHSWPI